MLVCATTTTLHTRPRVHRAPGIPARPLLFGSAEVLWHDPGEKIRAAGMRRCVFGGVSRRHCEEHLRRSNPWLRSPQDGLLRGACHRARVRATRWLAMTV